MTASSDHLIKWYVGMTIADPKLSGMEAHAVYVDEAADSLDATTAAVKLYAKKVRDLEIGAFKTAWSEFPPENWGPIEAHIYDVRSETSYIPTSSLGGERCIAPTREELTVTLKVYGNHADVRRMVGGARVCYLTSSPGSDAPRPSASSPEVDSVSGLLAVSEAQRELQEKELERLRKQVAELEARPTVTRVYEPIF